MGLLRRVSNRLGFKSAVWVSDRWLCWFDGLMAWVSDRRGFDGSCLCVWQRKKIRLRERVVVEGGRLIRRGFDGLCLCL